jgi:hypothetical protein
MTEKKWFPPGWDEERVQRVLEERRVLRSDDEPVDEPDTPPEDATETTMNVPDDLVSRVRELISRHRRIP